jgi:hypothetical protein
MARRLESSEAGKHLELKKPYSIQASQPQAGGKTLCAMRYAENFNFLTLRETAVVNFITFSAESRPKDPMPQLGVIRDWPINFCISIPSAATCLT